MTTTQTRAVPDVLTVAAEAARHCLRDSPYIALAADAMRHAWALELDVEWFTFWRATGEGPRTYLSAAVHAGTWEVVA